MIFACTQVQSVQAKTYTKTEMNKKIKECKKEIASLQKKLDKENKKLKGNYSAPRLGYINFWSKQRKYNFCFIIALLRKVDNFSM